MRPPLPQCLFWKSGCILPRLSYAPIDMYIEKRRNKLFESIHDRKVAVYWKTSIDQSKSNDFTCHLVKWCPPLISLHVPKDLSWRTCFCWCLTSQNRTKKQPTTSNLGTDPSISIFLHMAIWMIVWTKGRKVSFFLSQCLPRFAYVQLSRKMLWEGIMSCCKPLRTYLAFRLPGV